MVWWMKENKDEVPCTMPTKPLQLESLIWTTRFVPGRTLESLLMSLTAAAMAILATLPIVELNVKRAPMLTVSGLASIFLLIA
jgi:hypothetical protein